MRFSESPEKRAVLQFSLDHLKVELTYLCIPFFLCRLELYLSDASV